MDKRISSLVCIDEGAYGSYLRAPAVQDKELRSVLQTHGNGVAFHDFRGQKKMSELVGLLV